jgi:hypothetical protein
MRDPTQWRKDVDRSRRHLLDACRTGDMDAIAHATQTLQVLLERADRPQPARRAPFAIDAEATAIFGRGGAVRTDSKSDEQATEL